MIPSEENLRRELEPKPRISQSTDSLLIPLESEEFPQEDDRSAQMETPTPASSPAGDQAARGGEPGPVITPTLVVVPEGGVDSSKSLALIAESSIRALLDELDSEQLQGVRAHQQGEEESELRSLLTQADSLSIEAKQSLAHRLARSPVFELRGSSLDLYTALAQDPAFPAEERSHLLFRHAVALYWHTDFSSAQICLANLFQIDPNHSKGQLFAIIVSRRLAEFGAASSNDESPSSLAPE